MRELGLFGVTIPEEYGGLGLDLLTYIGVIEELAAGWMSLTGIVNTHTMAATLMMHHGNEEQKQRWLPSMATGERRGALSLSEPDAGSDTRNISCRAERDGDEYVAQRHQGVGHERRAGVDRGARGAHAPRASARSSSRRSPGSSFEGISRQPPHRQARLQGRRDGRDVLRRPPDPGGEPDRRARPRPPPDPQRAGDRPDQHRRAGRRRRPGRVRRRPRATPRCAPRSASRSPSIRRSS